MKSASVASFAILVVGLLLLMLGFSASESFASELSELFQGTPSNKSILLIGLGAVVAIAGLAGVLRSR